jgi:hypothetical protein
LEKIAFWAIIEGPFAGYAFRGVNGCCMGFGFWGKKIAQVFLLRSKAPSHLFLPVCVSVCLFVYLLPIHLSMRQPLSVCNNAG